MFVNGVPSKRIDVYQWLDGFTGHYFMTNLISDPGPAKPRLTVKNTLPRTEIFQTEAVSLHKLLQRPICPLFHANFSPVQEWRSCAPMKLQGVYKFIDSIGLGLVFLR